MSHLSNILLGFGGYLLGASIAHLLINTRISMKYYKTVTTMPLTVDWYICIKESDYFSGIKVGDVFTQTIIGMLKNEMVTIDLANHKEYFAYYKSVPSITETKKQA